MWQTMEGLNYNKFATLPPTGCRTGVVEMYDDGDIDAVRYISMQ